MRTKGMTYDTGFVRAGEISRKHFDPEVVRRELEIIRDDLHCNGVHIIGGDPGRLEVAARAAAELGFEVWFSPYPLDVPADEIMKLFTECARRAESVRQTGAEVVFVAGAELTLMNPGFLPGDTLETRLGGLLGAEPARRIELIGDLSRGLNEFLGKAVAAIRGEFGGKVTYAAVPLERVDWELFDIMSVELIRSAAVAAQFREGVRTLVGQGKPVAITGFGSAAWKGAPDVAPRAMEIVENDEHGVPVRLNGDYERDEEGQATYLREVLEVFDSEGVDAAFVFMFALENYPHRSGRDDLDLASPSIVKVYEDRRGETYPDMAWEPKTAFHAVADIYRDRVDAYRD